MSEISNIKHQISNALVEAVESLTGDKIEAEVTLSSDPSKGDLTTNVAMTAFAKVKSEKLKVKSPLELAEEIVKNWKLDIGNLTFLDRVEVKAPGFINFWLSQSYISNQVNSLLKHDKKVEPATKSLIFEFGDPNPFKEPHIGHMRNFILGEAICRLNEGIGTKVVRASYQGDVGAHVAKAIWGIQSSKLKVQSFENETLEKRVKFLAESYAKGAKAYEENEKAKEEIISINNKIYKNDPEIKEVWQTGRKWSLDHFETLYKVLGIKYDKYYFESQTAPLGIEIVKQNTPKVFEEDDGALVFRGEKAGLHTRVFVTSEGYATYEGKDLALAAMKDQDFPEIDRSIIMTANEQTDYFKVMLAALKLIDPKVAAKTTHLSFGFVNLKEGKMSSRSGNIVEAFWLLSEVKKRLKNGFKTVEKDVLEDLTVGAVKWSMLKFSRESNISFDISESVQIEGNSGPYMQYTYARTQSLLSKSQKNLVEAKVRENLEPDLLALGRLICQFEIVTEDAGEKFAPNILTNYLYNLAQAFNLFYEKKRIIGESGEEQRLLIVKAVGEVLQKGLHLLGIAAPSKI